MSHTLSLACTLRAHAPQPLSSGLLSHPAIEALAAEESRDFGTLPRGPLAEDLANYGTLPWSAVRPQPRSRWAVPCGPSAAMPLVHVPSSTLILDLPSIHHTHLPAAPTRRITSRHRDVRPAAARSILTDARSEISRARTTLPLTHRQSSGCPNWRASTTRPLRSTRPLPRRRALSARRAVLRLGRSPASPAAVSTLSAPRGCSRHVAARRVRAAPPATRSRRPTRRRARSRPQPRGRTRSEEASTLARRLHRRSHLGRPPPARSEPCPWVDDGSDGGSRCLPPERTVA